MTGGHVCIHVDIYCVHVCTYVYVYNVYILIVQPLSIAVAISPASTRWRMGERGGRLGREGREGVPSSRGL